MTGFAISKRVGFSGRAELHLLVFPLPRSYLPSLVASLLQHSWFPICAFPRAVTPDQCRQSFLRIGFSWKGGNNSG